MAGVLGPRLLGRAALLTFATLGLLPLAACRAQPQRLTVQVLASVPHDPAAFTEGLLYADGRLYESTGLVGRSTVREVDPASGAVIRQRALPAPYFGEGLALVGDHLIQLTYRAGVAFVWDRQSFNPAGRFRYAGQGWGLCYDGTDLFMSDGSATITRRDPHTFAPEGTLTVRRSGRPVTNINELECVGNDIYANVWLTDEILRIDKRNGDVSAVVDASALRASLPALDDPDAVLNGIAYDTSDGRFLLTGKLWPELFAVRFVPAGGGAR